jgi:hypothetical protein
MDKLLSMLRFNVPLSQHASFDRTTHGAGFGSSLNSDNMAATIFRQLSHPDAVRLVGTEFEKLPPVVRLLVRDLCHKGNCSGNVRKGIQALNRQMSGTLLREERHAPTFQTMTADGWKSKPVNPAVAGAMTKYAERGNAAPAKSTRRSRKARASNVVGQNESVLAA